MHAAGVLRWVVPLLLICSFLITITPVASADPSDVSVGGLWVFRITQGAAGLTPEQRIVEVNRRITDVLSVYRSGQKLPVVIRPSGSAASIIVGNIVVVTVGPDDVRGTKVTPLELANQWAQRLQAGLIRALPDATNHVF